MGDPSLLMYVVVMYAIVVSSLWWWRATHVCEAVTSKAQLISPKTYTRLQTLVRLVSRFRSLWISTTPLTEHTEANATAEATKAARQRASFGLSSIFTEDLYSGLLNPLPELTRRLLTHFYGGEKSRNKYKNITHQKGDYAYSVCVVVIGKADWSLFDRICKRINIQIKRAADRERESQSEKSPFGDL